MFKSLTKIFLIFTYCIFVSATTPNAYAIDASDRMTIKGKIGDWYVVEYTAPSQIVYRIGSDSIKDAKSHFVIDFTPSDKCEPKFSELIVNLGYYDENFNNGKLPMEFKLPNQKLGVELVKTAMREGDTFAFFTFNSISARKMLLPKDKGKLAVSVLPSGDGEVKKSNIYFSLNGFSSAYKKAKALCSENK